MLKAAREVALQRAAKHPASSHVKPCLVCLINPEFKCRTCDNKICEACVTKIRLAQSSELRTLTMLCPRCAMGYGWQRL